MIVKIVLNKIRIKKEGRKLIVNRLEPMVRQGKSPAPNSQIQLIQLHQSNV